MYKIPANTVFVGKNLVYIAQCQSTNALAGDLGQRIETPDGTVIVTDDQTAGRGQRGNKWESQPGKNLTFSLILKPGFLQVKDQFYLNQAISIGITDYITKKVSEKVHIKWPNDLLVDGKKIGGILIENHLNGDEITYSIIGVGLNINQHSFPYPTAASLKVFTGIEYDLGTELPRVLADIEARYLELKLGQRASLETKYLELLYQIGETRQFRSNDVVFEGTIIGITDAGQLTVLIGTETRFFGVKEITFL